MRYLIALISIISLLAIIPNTVHAQSTNGCVPIFGGGDSCVQKGSLAIDKKFRNPVTNQFIDQASINDVTFSPDQQVVFQITVTNTSTRTIENITVTDVFPQYVLFTKGSGTFDAKTNTATYTIKNLAAKQTNTVTLEGKIDSLTALPTTNGILCVVNDATVTQARNIASDNAQFCLQIQGQPQPVANQAAPTAGTPPVMSAPIIAIAPQTGPELLGLLGLIPAGLTGLYLRRKTSNS